EAVRPEPSHGARERRDADGGDDHRSVLLVSLGWWHVQTCSAARATTFRMGSSPRSIRAIAFQCIPIACPNVRWVSPAFSRSRLSSVPVMLARISRWDIAVHAPAGEPGAEGGGIDADDPGGQADDRHRVGLIGTHEALELSGRDSQALRNLREGEQR